MQQQFLNGGQPQTQQIVFQTPQQTFINYSSDGQVFLGSPMSQNIYAQPSNPATNLSSGPIFSAHFRPTVSKVFAIIFILLGLIMITGGILESISQDGYSHSDFAPYWCGASIILLAGIMIYASCQISNTMVIVDLVADVLCFGFAVAAVAICAEDLGDVKSYRQYCGFSWYLFTCKDLDLMTAGYSLAIGCSCITIILSIILAIELIHTLVRGCKTKANCQTVLPSVTFQAATQPSAQPVQQMYFPGVESQAFSSYASYPAEKYPPH